MAKNVLQTELEPIDEELRQLLEEERQLQEARDRPQSREEYAQFCEEDDEDEDARWLSRSASRQSEIEEQRQAVKAWADSPEFPAGAPWLVFHVVGLAVTGYDVVLELLSGLQAYAGARAMHDDGDRIPYDILNAASLAFLHHQYSGQGSLRSEAFKRFCTAAFDYCATDGGVRPPDTFRRPYEFRAYLLERIRWASALPKNVYVKLDVLCEALCSGQTLFPELRAADGIRAPIEIMRERLAKFDASRLAKLIPLPGEGVAEGGEAADIAFDLLILAGVPNKVVRNFIVVAGDMQTLRKDRKADPAGTATTPRRPRGPRPRG